MLQFLDRRVSKIYAINFILLANARRVEFFFAQISFIYRDILEVQVNED